MNLYWNICILSIVSVSAQQNVDLTLRGSRRLQSQCPNFFDRFDIINSTTDQKVASLKDGDTIYLDSSGLSSPQEINIMAVPCGTGSIGSVKFNLDGNYHQKIENAAAYLMCGNSGSDAYPCSKMTLGPHTLTVSAHSLTNAAGSLLGSVASLSFMVVQSNLEPTTAAPVPSPKITPAPFVAPTTAAPVSSPKITPAPVVAPTTAAPVPSPKITPSPIVAPTITEAPVLAPVTTPPIPSTSCPVPKLIGGWVDYLKYPFNILESQGAMIGDDFVFLSGFKNSFSVTTLESYALNTASSTAKWRRMDDAPLSIAPGFSHSAYAKVGSKIYLCGGYWGPDPGADFRSCFVYNHSVPPGGNQQWSTTEVGELPDGRGGAGMVYDKKRNALYFAGGAKRIQNTTKTYDKPDTWMFDLDNPSGGWVQKANMPYQANHLAAVTAKDENGIDRHFFLGGQTGHNEANGNFAKNYEWDAVNEKWIARADMPLTRGHFSSSTRAIGCGFLIAGGTSNGIGKISNITFYDIKTDKWTGIGNLWANMNTPICDIATNSNGEMWLYCDGHWYGRKRIRISL